MVKKSKNNTILYISISIAVIVVLIIILGFITNWNFFAKKKIDTSQSSNDKPINDSSNAFNIDNVDPEIFEMDNAISGYTINGSEQVENITKVLNVMRNHYKSLNHQWEHKGYINTSGSMRTF